MHCRRSRYVFNKLNKLEGNVKSFIKKRKIYERDIKGKSGIKRNYKFQQMSNEI